MSGSSKVVLVTGGAGYVGSHTCLALAEAGYEPIVYDNLSNGHAGFVRWGPFERGDIRDGARLDEVFDRYKPAAVVHFAALIEVGQSVVEPLSFYENNVAGTVSLLAAMRRAAVDAIVFSSTCATYGDPQRIPMSEDHPQVPESPYGASKYMVERVLKDAEVAHGLRGVNLRYFNAAGADQQGRIGEWHDPETHAIPLVLQAAMGRRAAFSLFGTDYDTRDGTCVRDYIHVLDLADAHVRALRYLLDGGEGTAFNLGTGTGTTVRELVRAISDATGLAVPTVEADRRPGDVATLVADNAKARDTLGWQPTRGIEEIVRDAFAWHSSLDRRLSTEAPPLVPDIEQLAEEEAV